jgi:hypothetical protein
MIVLNYCWSNAREKTKNRTDFNNMFSENLKKMLSVIQNKRNGYNNPFWEAKFERIGARQVQSYAKPYFDKDDDPSVETPSSENKLNPLEMMLKGAAAESKSNKSEPLSDVWLTALLNWIDYMDAIESSGDEDEQEDEDLSQVNTTDVVDTMTIETENTGQTVEIEESADEFEFSDL